MKYKELIAVAVALSTQCPYCIDIHTGNARKAGASDAELTERPQWSQPPFGPERLLRTRRTLCRVE